MQPPENSPKKILVIDDEALVGDTIRRVLELESHEVKMANSGEQALAVFEPGKFDVVIIDYEMPVMKGDQVAAAIRSQAPHQKILMITAYGEGLRAQGRFPLPVDGVVTKPFDFRELLKTVRQLAASPSPNSAAKT